MAAIATYNFFNTETQWASEPREQFEIRRLVEELDFFGSLSKPENYRMELQLTNFPRDVTRKVTQAVSYISSWIGTESPCERLPNNVYRFSGLWGIQQTAGVTRKLSQAQTNEEFIKGLKDHLLELYRCSEEMIYHRPPSERERIFTVAQQCIQGLLAYKDSYKYKYNDHSLLSEIVNQIRDNKKQYRQLVAMLDEVIKPFVDLVKKQKDFQEGRTPPRNQYTYQSPPTNKAKSSEKSKEPPKNCFVEPKLHMQTIHIQKTHEEMGRNFSERMKRKDRRHEAFQEACEVLGIHVDWRANIEFRAIKLQFRKLALQYHPDRRADQNDPDYNADRAAEVLRTLTNAYTVLEFFTT